MSDTRLRDLAAEFRTGHRRPFPSKTRAARRADRASRPVTSGWKFARLRAGALARGFEVSLTLDDYRRITEDGRCEYCHGPLPRTGHGIDRKDSAVGYTLENVVPACGACNELKGALLTHAQMLELGAVVLQRWRDAGAWPPASYSVRRRGRPRLD